MTALPTTSCRGCGKPIVFADVMKADGGIGKVPLDPKAPCYAVRALMGGVVRAQRASGLAAGEEVMVSHFATCAKASDFSRGKNEPSAQDQVDDLRGRLQKALDRVAVLEEQLRRGTVN